MEGSFDPKYPEHRDELRERIATVTNRIEKSIYGNLAKDCLTLLELCERLGEAHNILQDENKTLYRQLTLAQEFSNTQLEEIRAQRRELENIKTKLTQFIIKATAVGISKKEEIASLNELAELSGLKQ